ncbi:tetratricopeptide repeat protein [Spirochaeta cellobiosiphila]|uniref:tetratricopeptide repeat protein n=1 Tax=Spirochaeta cellobiosiphila TaxID=504483 RepID=UPI00042A0308|nr:tetratricopeptide repeat protein [Spirochaeta cellobiosiphila]
MNKGFFIVIGLLLSFSLPLFSQRADALALYREGKYDEAIAACRADLQMNAENMDAYTIMGWSLVRKGSYDQARIEMEKALKVRRYDYRIIESLGESYFYLGRNLDALKYFEEYSSIAPSEDRIDTVFFFMGEIFIRLGEYHHADIALSTAVHHAPNVARWWARLGYARERAKDYTWAKVAYQKALELNPGLEDAIRGLERSQQG